MIAVISFIIFSKHSLYRHFTFNSHAFDLGIYTQAIYLYGHGQLAFSTLKHMPILADHFGLILAFLSPIYNLFPQATTLLIFQSIFVSISSILIYQIALDKLKSLLASSLLAITYLTSVGILSSLSFDFHLTTISVLPLSFMLYSWYFKNWKLYWLSALIGIIFKEDIPLFILGMGFFLLFQKQFKLAISTIIFAFVSVFLIKFTIMPALWKGAETAYIYTSTLPLNSPIDLVGLIIVRPSVIIDQLFNSPVKIQTVQQLYSQFIYLPFLSPLSWFTIFPSLFLRFSSSYIQTWTNTYHHSSNLAPFLAVSAILVIDQFKLPAKFISLILLFILFTGSLAPNSFVWNSLLMDLNNKHYGYLINSLNNIPQSAAVSAQSPIVPHLANRQKIYLFPEIYDAQYIILDKSLSSYPLTFINLEDKINSLSKSSQWELIVKLDNLFIFKRI